MWRWLSLPVGATEYETFAARVLHYTLLLLICVALLFVFFVSSPLQLIFIPVFLGILGYSYYSLHTGRFRPAGLIFVTGVWIVITLASFYINGIRNASISLYAVVIIFSAVLFSARAVAISTALSVLSLIILAVGEMGGVLPLRTTSLYVADRFFQQVGLFSAAGILLASASRVIRSSFERIRDHEETLLERNRLLEDEITERKRTEANLRISEEKYRLLFENIPVMAAVYGPDGEFILLNDATARLLGSTPQAFQGRNIRDVVAAQDAEDVINRQAQVMQDGKDVISENKIRLLNGREFYYVRHIIPLPDSVSGTPSQVLVLTSDLTDKYLAEQRERELALAQEKNDILTDFFNTLSHDLKTPLTVISTSLYLLERAESVQKRQEIMARIGNHVALMNQYIQDMLAISRLERLPLLNVRELNLNSLIEEVVDALNPRIEDRKLIFQFTGQPDLPVIWGDQDQLLRMLTNLIENAINYTPSGGKVIVRTYTSNGAVVLEVTDSGIGIEPDDLPHIFERFFRTKKAKNTRSGGTGLGLPIVKKIVEMHHATIQVTSQLDEGTTFLVQFQSTLADSSLTPE